MCNLTGSILNALNMEAKSFLNYILGSCILLISLIILTPIIGINSIIISHFASMSSITLLNLKKIKTASEEFITHYKLTAIMGVVYLRKANGVAIL